MPDPVQQTTIKLSPTKGSTGLLAFEHMGIRLPLQVLLSGRGYYLGTANDSGPVSRESVETWNSFDAAEAALEGGADAWTQRDHP